MSPRGREDLEVIERYSKALEPIEIRVEGLKMMSNLYFLSGPLGSADFEST